MTSLPPVPQLTVDAIMAALEERHASQAHAHYKGYGIPASALGTPCDRQIWLSLRWASAKEMPNGKTLRIFARGRDAETRVINDLRAAGFEVTEVDPSTGRQWRFGLANGLIRGKADGAVMGIPEAPKSRHVIEIKEIKAADWRAIKKHGLLAKKPEHWHQLHAGMAGLGADRGLYIASNADTQELLSERIYLDRAEIARQEARVLRAADADAPELGMLADATTEIKAGEIKGSPPCLFCDHRALCFDGAWAQRSCRTCLHFSFGPDGNGHCARFQKPLTPASQEGGARCPAHLFLPALVPGEQIDADPTEETVTYRLTDGTEWIDGTEQRETA